VCTSPPTSPSVWSPRTPSHKGVDEVLNETDHIRPSLLLLLDTPEASARAHRRLAFAQNFPASLLFQRAPSAAQWLVSHKAAWQGALVAPLPENVHLLSLQARYGTSRDLIIRLMHIFELGEHPTLSLPVVVDLAALLPSLAITQLTEMTLTANLPLSALDQQLLQWRRKGDNAGGKSERRDSSKRRLTANLTAINLEPMQIRTFLVNAEPLM